MFQGMGLVVPVHFHGTMAADATFRWKAPCDCILQHMSLVASNNSDATIKVGTSADDDAILASTTIGDSGTPVEKTPADYAAANPTGRLNKGDIFLVSLDHDGSSGTAAQNVSLVFTFTEG